MERMLLLANHAELIAKLNSFGKLERAEGNGKEEGDWEFGETDTEKIGAAANMSTTSEIPQEKCKSCKTRISEISLSCGHGLCLECIDSWY